MLPDKAKFVVCSIISLALSFWMKHLVISQLQKPAKILGFSLVNISKSSAFMNRQGSTFTETNSRLFIGQHLDLVGWLFWT